MKKLLAGNWKMNLTPNEEANLARDLADNFIGWRTNVELAVAPSYSGILEVSYLLKDTKINIVAQNCASSDKGALTGEESVETLLEMGVKYVILGHSERRVELFETDELIATKVQNATSKGLHVILCVGEKLSIRNEGLSGHFIQSQLLASLRDVTDYELLTIAYEPIWAISTSGTGKVAKPQDIEKMHEHIKNVLSKKYGSAKAKEIRVLYGGSVNKDNVVKLTSLKNVDGALVGKASLDAENFLEMGIRMSEEK